jgi:ribose transport system ATP-binding protein
MHITMSGIKKSFGHVDVLKCVSLDVKDGSVHALMGENGAGKSTMIKILCGVHTMDAGEIIIDGNTASIATISDSEKYGIAYVHQELNVIANLTVAENMFLGREIPASKLRGRLGFADNAEMHKQCKQAFEQLGIDNIDPSQRMGQLTVGYQQMVEIAKALLFNAKTIILDEPTAALSQREIDGLFKVVRELQQRGVSFVYVSHRMNEIFELSDEITVIRDGVYIDTVPTAQTSENDLITMMTGKTIENLFPERENHTCEVALEVQNGGINGKFEQVNFRLYYGEVLGFSGLMGAGRSELMHSIFGSMPLESGLIRIDDEEICIDCPADASAQGIAFVTEDRKHQGLHQSFSITENICLPSLEKHRHHGFLLDSKMVQCANDNISKLNIKTPSPDQQVGRLSGGNQQKVVLAKWLETQPKILILDEPTRGVDVGAKREIYDIISRLKARGTAIIVVSSELSEVMGISDRIAVMHQGRLVDVLKNDGITSETILKIAFTGHNNHD